MRKMITTTTKFIGGAIAGGLLAYITIKITEKITKEKIL